MKKPGEHLRAEYSALGPPLDGEPVVRIPADDPLLKALWRHHADKRAVVLDDGGRQ